ncbi:MAG: Crp/Fnr family transcriptional regulator [Candidatus Limnocylindria bacterium]
MTDASGTKVRTEEEASLVAALAATWFGAGLAPEAQVRLAKLARHYQAPAGTTLLTEGEPANELGVVISGRVSLRTLIPERGMITILTVEPGDIFGQSAVVPPYRSTSNCVALQPVDVIALNGAGLRAALASDPLLAASLYPRLLEALARRLSATRLQMLDLFASAESERW